MVAESRPPKRWKAGCCEGNSLDEKGSCGRLSDMPADHVIGFVHPRQLLSLSLLLVVVLLLTRGRKVQRHQGPNSSQWHEWSCEARAGRLNGLVSWTNTRGWSSNPGKVDMAQCSERRCLAGFCNKKQASKQASCIMQAANRQSRYGYVKVSL